MNGGCLCLTTCSINLLKALTDVAFSGGRPLLLLPLHWDWLALLMHMLVALEGVAACASLLQMHVLVRQTLVLGAGRARTVLAAPGLV
jgi:hypothetical protein